MLADAATPSAGLTLTSGGSALVAMTTSFAGDQAGLSVAPAANGSGSSQFIPASPVVAPASARSYATRLAFTAGGPFNSTELYVNPDMSSLGTGSASTGGSLASFGSSLPFTFDAVSLFNGATGFTAVGFDEIRIGASWGDVSPVPEPAARVLLAGPVSWAWVARHRRGAADSGART